MIEHTTSPLEWAERHQLALEASWELESVASALIRASQGLNVDDLVIRALAIRVRQLAGVQTSALSDELVTVSTIGEQLSGFSNWEMRHV